jgi:hypothetical protein
MVFRRYLTPSACPECGSENQDGDDDQEIEWYVINFIRTLLVFLTFSAIVLLSHSVSGPVVLDRAAIYAFALVVRDVRAVPQNTC